MCFRDSAILNTDPVIIVACMSSIYVCLDTTEWRNRHDLPPKTRWEALTMIATLQWVLTPNNEVLALCVCVCVVCGVCMCVWLISKCGAVPLA